MFCVLILLLKISSRLASQVSKQGGIKGVKVLKGVYCGATVFDGFLHKKQARVTHKVETAIRAERTATWNGVKVASESVIRCQKIKSKFSQIYFSAKFLNRDYSLWFIPIKNGFEEWLKCST